MCTSRQTIPPQAAPLAVSWLATVALTSASAAEPGHGLPRLEALLRGLRAAYDEAFEYGKAVAYGEAQKEIQPLRKQLASERDRAERQRDQLFQLQRSADMRRLAEDRERPN
jgi:hypothetical protein